MPQGVRGPGSRLMLRNRRWLFATALALVVSLVLSAAAAADQSNPPAVGPRPAAPANAAPDFDASGPGDAPVLADPGTLAAEYAALQALYQSAGGARWRKSFNWLTDAPLGDWYGVTTGPSGRVEILSLAGNRLSGQIPDDLAELEQLRVLNLGRNGLRGAIPSALGRNSELASLDLSQNDLSGPIPTEFGNLAELDYLDISSNRISGQIPRELADSSRLRIIRAAGNNLSGPVPSQLGGLTSLEVLDLGSNRLRGPLPVELSGLTFLWELSLDKNALSGQIPPELGRMANLGILNLSSNQLTGQIPPELAQLAGLQVLILSRNGLTGEIPRQLGQLPKLASVLIDENHLTGQIPPGLAGLSSLRVLRLSNNDLSGSIPREFGNAARLLRLHLDGNELSGPIPPELGRLSEIQQLVLDRNRLSGPIHPALHRLHGFEELRLGRRHQFEGCLPAHWAGAGDSDIRLIGLPTCAFGLPGLDIGPGFLEPDFDPGVDRYVLWVGRDADQVTLAPILAGGSATFLDASNQALDDLDPHRDGHQISIAEISDRVVVQVTSADGARQARYQIVARQIFPFEVSVSDNLHVQAPGNQDLAHNIPDLEVVIDGQVVRADFLSHFRETGEIERWGYPTSEVLVLEPDTLTQFCQRGVVDFHRSGEGWVLERRLAWDYVGGGAGGSIDQGVEEDVLNPNPGRVLGPWGHRVSNFAVDGTEIGFADYFDRLGGVNAFGFPKTDARKDTGLSGSLHMPGATPGFIRQYFQAAVLEFHPGDAASPVKLTLLGDTLRRVLAPDFAREQAFGPARPLGRGDYLPWIIPTAPGFERAAASETEPPDGEFRERLARTGSVRLYESGISAPDRADRIFTDQFYALTARNVRWEFNFLLPPRGGIFKENVTVRYFGPGGRLLHVYILRIELHVPADRRFSQPFTFTGGHGRAAPGYWGPGRYRIDFSTGNQTLASSAFTIHGTQVSGTAEFATLRQMLEWGAAPTTRGQTEGLLNLARLHAADSQISASVASWPWMQSDLSESGQWILSALTDLVGDYPDLVRALVNAPWVSDGLLQPEIDALRGAIDLGPQTASLVFGQQVQSRQDGEWQTRLATGLRKLRDDDPALLSRLREASWFVDGITESEAALITVLPEIRHSEELLGELLAGPSPLERRISTSLSGEMDLAVVQLSSAPPDINKLDALERGARAIEDHLQIPWPTTDIVALIENRLREVRDAAGYFVGDYIVLLHPRPRFSFVSILNHELGHYFFNGEIVPIWLIEGGAEYLEHHGMWLDNDLTTSEWAEAVRARVEEGCHANGVRTVRDLLQAIDALGDQGVWDSPLRRCYYNLGHSFLFQMRQLLGPEAVGSTLGQVIGAAQSFGQPAGDDQVLAAFLESAPPEKRAAVDATIAAVYGNRETA